MSKLAAGTGVLGWTIVVAIVFIARMALESVVEVHTGTSSGNETQDGLVHVHEHGWALRGGG